MSEIDISTTEFVGIVLEDPDPKVQGRYKVHIPSLQPLLEYKRGIWCKNHVHKYRITSSKYGEYGQYFPLHPDTKVIVRFFSKDYRSGYIDRIVSDYRSKTDVLAQDCTEGKTSNKDRDNQYVLLKTPKYWNALYINEDTDKEPNRIILEFNRDKESTYTEREVEEERERRSVFTVSEEGYRWWTHDNDISRIRLDKNTQIDGNRTDYIKGYKTENIKKDHDLSVYENQRYKIHKNQSRWIKKDRLTNIDGDDKLHLKGKQHILKDDDQFIINKKKQQYLNEDDIDIHNKTNIKEKTDGNIDDKLLGNLIKNIIGNADIKIVGNVTGEITAILNLTINAPANIFSSTSINADAPIINLNCGIAQSIPAAETTDPVDPEYPKSIPIPKFPESYEDNKVPDEDPEEDKSSDQRYDPTWTDDGFIHAEFPKAITRVRDLGPKETKEYELEDEYKESEENKDMRQRKQVVGEKCDDVTKKYNIEHRECLDGKPYYDG